MAGYVWISFSVYTYIYLYSFCVEDKNFSPYLNFKALLVKVEPHKQQHVLHTPTTQPYFYFFFHQCLSWQTLAGLSALSSSEVVQKRTHATTVPPRPHLPIATESPVKSYTTLKHSIIIKTTYRSICPARENKAP